MRTISGESLRSDSEALNDERVVGGGRSNRRAGLPGLKGLTGLAGLTEGVRGLTQPMAVATSVLALSALCSCGPDKPNHPGDAGSDSDNSGITDSSRDSDTSTPYSCTRFPATDTGHVALFTPGQMRHIVLDVEDVWVRFTFNGLVMDTVTDEPGLKADASASCPGCVGIRLSIPSNREIREEYSDSWLQLCSGGTTVTCTSGPNCTALIMNSHGWVEQ